MVIVVVVVVVSVVIVFVAVVVVIIVAAAATTAAFPAVQNIRLLGKTLSLLLLRTTALWARTPAAAAPIPPWSWRRRLRVEGCGSHVSGLADELPHSGLLGLVLGSSLRADAQGKHLCSW